MDKELAASILIVLLGLLIAVHATITSLNESKAWRKGQGLLIVVTFPGLVDDVKQLLCRSDKVVSLVPPGVDPHSYTLSLRDVELAERASLVISTGHAPFEIRLRSYVSSEKLIEIPRIPGIELKKIPGTSSPNLHMPIYDIHNYMVFIKFVAAKLSSLRPSCRHHYMLSASKVLNKAIELSESAPRLNIQGVGSVPPTQYAVEWLGIDVRALLLASPEAGVTIHEYDTVRKLLESGRASIAIIVSNSVGGCSPASKADEKLYSLAHHYRVPAICVPAPYLPGSTIAKLEYIVSQAKSIHISS